MSPTRQELHRLQKTRSYVFHGTAVKVKQLHPRLAFNYIQGRRVMDERAAVYATPFADIAIFMAVVNEKNCPRRFRSGFSCKDSTLSFRATQATLDQLSSKSSGYVYIFKKQDFKKINPSESVSYKAVKPFRIVKVTRRDLPSKIFIIQIDKEKSRVSQ